MKITASMPILTSGKSPGNFAGPHGIALAWPRFANEERWVLFRGHKEIFSWDLKMAEVNNWNPIGDFCGICLSACAAVQFVAGEK